MGAYRRTARERQATRELHLEQRRQRALDIARQAAKILCEDFGVSQVRLFGSMLPGKRLHERSDIDLAVWGMPEKEHYRAVGKLLGLSEFDIELVEFEKARPAFQKVIMEEGIIYKRISSPVGLRARIPD